MLNSSLSAFPIMPSFTCPYNAYTLFSAPTATALACLSSSRAVSSNTTPSLQLSSLLMKYSFCADTTTTTPSLLRAIPSAAVKSLFKITRLAVPSSTSTLNSFPVFD
ncbi:UNVERIFIED_CONTAM: hypothetical protein Slati_1806900 [Sesamum latifolium]|uniref:Uncharacterized protein n=1 Tax=Sesamum latifolium TaxID=2727402 RepID=A0AAW2X3E0_9LAMI